jgi:PhzF family phenazine biosynthesis protein
VTDAVTSPLYCVDAFTAEPFTGNPAAICLLDEPLPEPRMQAVAAELNLSETAFVVAGDGGEAGEYELRWFTPTQEVELCGHATLASAHVLFETGRVPADTTVVFHTRSGELRAERTNDGIQLDFPIAEPRPEPPIPALFEALGVRPVDFLRTDGDFFVCVVDNPATVRALEPDFGALRAAPGVRGVYVTALADDDPHVDIVSRCFAPMVGIDEDPVTGSMHCILAAYWCPRLNTDELHAYQASARGGNISVLRKHDRALITGRAITVIEGELRA